MDADARQALANVLYKLWHWPDDSGWADQIIEELRATGYAIVPSTTIDWFNIPGIMENVIDPKQNPNKE
jgi:hypothetical protein